MCVSYLHVLLSEREANHALKAVQREKIMSAFVNDPKTPKFSPMADDTITQGAIGSLESLWSIRIFPIITLTPTLVLKQGFPNCGLRGNFVWPANLNTFIYLLNKTRI